MGLPLVASLFSIWIGISVALIEILVGVLAGNLLHLQANSQWIGFLAMLGSGVLTFLSGAEIALGDACRAQCSSLCGYGAISAELDAYVDPVGEN